MNLLFLDSYFEPEKIAYTHLEKDLLEGLIQENSRIQIICPTPTRGVSDTIREEYKYRKNETLYEGRIRVRRFWAPQEGKNPMVRALRYLWCNLRSYQIAMRVKRVDVVFSNSTPPTQGGCVPLYQRSCRRNIREKFHLSIIFRIFFQIHL